MPTYGVWIRNGRNIKVVDDETDILAVRDNFSWVSPAAGATNMQGFGYIEDEISAFQLTSNIDVIGFSNLFNRGRMGVPNAITAIEGAAPVRVRRRTLAKTSKLGGSGPGWGIRIWASNPRRLAFDSGHKIFQPRAFHSLRYGQTFFAPNNSWIIPLNWFAPENAFSSILCIRQSATSWRIGELLSQSQIVPRDIPLAQFWIMDNI